MRDIYLEIAKLVLMILAALITRYLIPWIKAKTEGETISLICDWTAHAVLAAEQTHCAGAKIETVKVWKRRTSHLMPPLIFGLLTKAPSGALFSCEPMEG